MINLNSYAKINIGLDVTDRLENGYHNIKTIMQTISLCDELSFKKSTDITIETDCGVSLEDNIIYKAIRLMQEMYTDSTKGMSVILNKHIPMGAGLGGGSSNASMSIIAYDKLYELNLTEEKKCEIAKKVGADVTVLMYRGTFLCEGIGEKLTRIENEQRLFVVLVKPDYAISTKEAYDYLDNIAKSTTDFDRLILDLKNGNVDQFGEYVHNCFEHYTSTLNDSTMTIKSQLYSLNADYASLSGSGSVVYGLYKNKSQAQSALQSLSKMYDKVYLADFIVEN